MSPSGLNDFRPVVQMSHVIKDFFLVLVLAHIGPLVKSSLDSLQFSKQLHVGVASC